MATSAAVRWDFPPPTFTCTGAAPPGRRVCGQDVRDRSEPVAGVANLGRRPTVGGLRMQLEVHLFDFQQDIYGRHIQVDFLAFLRPEQRFDSLDALQRQIQADSSQARAFFADPTRRSG